MRFDTYGPFEVIKKDGQIEKGEQSSFWNAVSAESEYWTGEAKSLQRAIGCYAFVIYDRVYRPWYVGKTVADGGFRDEIFEKHKRDIYNEYVSQRRGTPYMFLFPLLTDSGQLSEARIAGAEVIDWLEKTLIGMAFAKNPGLRNVANTKHLRSVSVYGLIGSRRQGRPDGYTVQVRQAFLATPRPPRRPVEPS